MSEAKVYMTYRICHKLTVEIRFYETSLEKCN